MFALTSASGAHQYRALSLSLAPESCPHPDEMMRGKRVLRERVTATLSVSN